jgi:hypothetical protein
MPAPMPTPCKDLRRRRGDRCRQIPEGVGRLERPLVPRRVLLVEGRTGQTAPRRRRLPLVVLELVGALAAHAVEVILSAGMLRPRRTTLGTFAQPPESAGSLPPLLSLFQKAAHSLEDDSFRTRTWRDGRSFLTRLWSASIRTDPACRCRCGMRDRAYGYLPWCQPAPCQLSSGRQGARCRKRPLVKRDGSWTRGFNGLTWRR